jgi:hypothetical protein
MIYFPEEPSTGQVYVGINGVSYTWMGDRWSGTNALETGRADFFVEGGDSAFEYIAPRDTTLDGGDSARAPSIEVNIQTVINQSSGNHYITYELINVTGKPINESGIIVSQPGHCNYDDTVEYCDEGSSQYGIRSARRTNSTYYDLDCSDPIVSADIIDGVYSQAIPYWSFSEQTVEVRAYVIYGQGQPIYSGIRTIFIDYVPCFVAGTQITLADGSKKAIEAITYDDDLLVWDFDAGCQSSARPVWIKRPQSIPDYNHARFADGTELKTLQVVQGHRVFCADTNQFEFVGSLPVGSTVVKDGGSTTLTSVEHAHGMVTYHNIMTQHHMNLYANNVLTSTGFNNLYPVKDMKFEKEAREPRTYKGIAEYWISGLRLAENTTQDVAAMTRHLNMLDSLKLGK